jgi:hemerythrin
MPVRWNPDLLTGLVQLDEQHERIFRALADLEQAIGSGQGAEALGKVLSGLALLVEAHFRAEERVMVRTGYDAISQHQLAHDDVRSRVEGMVDRYHEGTLDAGELLAFMEWWLDDHIRREDQPLADFLKVGEAAG